MGAVRRAQAHSGCRIEDMEVLGGKRERNGRSKSEPEEGVYARDGDLPIINADLNELLGPEQFRQINDPCRGDFAFCGSLGNLNVFRPNSDEYHCSLAVT